MTRMMPAVAAIVLLTGCASTTVDPTPSASDAPPAQDFTVELVDLYPLNAYVGLDDGQCQASGLDGSDAAPPQITIEDGDGTVLAVQDAPEVGGTFDPGVGCTFDIAFEDLPTSDIQGYVYVVTVVADGELTVRTENGDMGSVTVVF